MYHPREIFPIWRKEWEEVATKWALWRENEWGCLVFWRENGDHKWKHKTQLQRDDFATRTIFFFLLLGSSIMQNPVLTEFAVGSATGQVIWRRNEDQQLFICLLQNSLLRLKMPEKWEEKDYVWNQVLSSWPAIHKKTGGHLCPEFA